MHQIGIVKQLQVQRASLTVGEKPNRSYDPTPLVVVQKLYLTRNGGIGQSLEGERIVDIHNNTHPLSRNRGDNGISLGFTSHYQTMRTRFGLHITDGVAGENILVETEAELTSTKLAHGLIIQSRQTGESLYLTAIAAISPCLEFAHFAMREREASNEQIKETLQFLQHGRRGFYAKLATGQDEGIIEVGDVVFVGDE
jgi:hypothetical protein